MTQPPSHQTMHSDLDMQIEGGVLQGASVQAYDLARGQYAGL